MQLLRRLLTIVLGLSLAATAVAWVADATIWNQTYLENAVQSTNLAAGLSTALPAMAASYTPDAHAKAAFINVLTPTYINSQLQTIIPSFIDAYRHDGPRPTLNLTDIGQEFTTLNAPVPPNLQALIDQPIPLLSANLDTPLRLIGHLTGQLRWLAPFIALAVAVLIFILTGHRRWKGLAAGTFLGAILTALAGLIALAPPGLIGATLGNSIARPLEPVIRPLTNLIAHDQLAMLIKIAAGLAVLGIVWLILNMATHMHQRFGKSKSDPKTETSSEH